MPFSKSCCGFCPRVVVSAKSPSALIRQANKATRRIKPPLSCFNGGRSQLDEKTSPEMLSGRAESGANSSRPGQPCVRSVQSLAPGLIFLAPQGFQGNIALEFLVVGAIYHAHAA